MAAWQNGAFTCGGPRDRWIGWKPAQPFRRLEWLANPTRFLVLSTLGVFPNLASFFLARRTRRLADGGLATHGHRATGCSGPRRSGTRNAFPTPGTGRRAGRAWAEPGGFARAHGQYTDPHGTPKERFLTPLRPDARARLARPQPLSPEGVPPADPGRIPRHPGAMRALQDERLRIPGFGRRQGRMHTTACVLCIHLLAELAHSKGCLAAAPFAQARSQEELAAVGAWRNHRTGRCEPPPRPRAIGWSRGSTPKLSRTGSAGIAGPGSPWPGRWPPTARASAVPTATARATTRPWPGLTPPPAHPSLFGISATRGGELAAPHDLPERRAIRGRVVTLDALYTTRTTAKRIPERSGADDVFSVKGNAPETFDLLNRIPWERDVTGPFTENLEKAHSIYSPPY